MPLLFSTMTTQSSTTPSPLNSKRRRRDPLYSLPGEKVQKGDDTRFIETNVRTAAPPALKGNDVIELDPSKGSMDKKAPENEPPTGNARPLPEKLQTTEDKNSLAPGMPHATDPDDVSHVHAETRIHLAEAGAGETGTSSKVDAQGFLGKRAVESDEILSATVNPTTGRSTGYSPADLRTTVFTEGNAIKDQTASGALKGITNTRQDTLRPLYGMADPLDTVPDVRAQLKSDLLFQDFSVVAPGHGLGVTNKMFLMEEARDRKIVYAEPLAEPRTYGGPSGLVLPEPLEWQNEITAKDRRREDRENERQLARMMLAADQVGDGSTNVLGNDVGYLRAASDKGLTRPAESVLEPVIRRPAEMERVRPLTGQQLNDRQMRRLFDPMRFPERFSVMTAMSGGFTTTPSRALALLDHPIGSA